MSDQDKDWTKGRPPAIRIEHLPRPPSVIGPPIEQPDATVSVSGYQHDDVVEIPVQLSDLAADVARISARCRDLQERFASYQASSTNLIAEQHDLLVHLHARLQEAIGLVDAGATARARAILESQVLALDRLRPL